MVALGSLFDFSRVNCVLYSWKPVIYLFSILMTKFLSRLILFVSIASLIFGGWGVLVVGIELVTYHSEIKMPAGAYILVCGDSQPAHAFDPMRWPGLFNFSRDATLLDQMRMKMTDVFAANPQKVQTVIIDISPWKFYVNDPHSALIDNDASAAQLLINVFHWNENRRSMRGFVKIFRESILIKKSGQLNRLFFGRRRYCSTLCGGFVQTDKAHFIDAPERVASNIRRLANSINAAPSAGTGTAVFDEWRLMVEYSRRAGVKHIVLVTTPFHNALREAIDTEKLNDFRKKARAFAREVGCPYIDFLDFGVPDMGWRDGNHLNRFGAALFTDAFRKAVNL